MNMLSRLREMFAKAPTGLPLIEEATAFSANALLSSGAFLQYNPDDLFTRKGYKIYKQMMMDEQVKAVVRFHRDAVTGRSWKFEDNPLLTEEENDLRRSILTVIIAKMPGSFKTRLDMVMSSIYNGFSLVEKTFELIEHEGKQWAGIKKLSLKPFETFFFNTDDYGELVSLEQVIGGHKATLEIKNFIHHVQNADMHEYYGQSELREAHRAWYCKDTTIKLQNLFLERAAAGFVYATPRKGTTLTAKSPEYAGLKKVLENIRGTASMILPASVDLNVVHPRDTQAFDRAIQGHDKAIAKSLLMPNLLGLSEQGPSGSRALGDTQLEAFLWMLDAEAGNLEEVMNEQLFQDLADQNFPDGLYPRWRLNELSNDKVMETMKTWKELVTGNAVKPTSQDEKHIRSVLDFPISEIDEEEAAPVDPDTALSGIQITSMLKIIEQVGSESIPRETGIQILLNAFPINLETAERIMGEVGRAFKPKGTPSRAPVIPATGNDEGDPVPGEETVIGEDGVQIISAPDMAKKKLQAENRVAFKVIERKSTDIQDEAVTELSDLIMAMVKPVTDELREVEEFDADIVKDIKFDSRAISKIQKASKRMLTVAWQLGIKHAKDEVNKAAGKQLSVSFARLDQDAAKYFDGKSFTMTGKLTGDMTAIVQNTISQGIKSSATIDEVVNQIYEAFGTEGFISKAAAESEMTKLLDAVSGGGAARLHTVVRTNIFEAINEARYSFFTDPGLDNFVEALEYSAILDSRVTQICEYLDGHEHATEGEVWGGMWRPPNHYNCRSLLIPITVNDKWTESAIPTQFPQEGFR